MRHLVDLGADVRALSRDPAKAQLPSGVQVVAGDLTEASSLIPALDGATAMHLINFGSGQQLENGTEIVDLIAKSGVRKVTLLRGGYPTELESALQASELDWTFIQPVEFMSGLLEWAPSIRDEGVVRAGFPKSLSAIVDESDIGSVIAAVLTSDGHSGMSYTLTGPHALTVPDKVRIIAESTGREIAYVELSEDEVRARWRGQGMPENVVEYLVSAHRDTPEMGYTVVTTVHDVTGKPARSLAEWATDHAEHFR